MEFANYIGADLIDTVISIASIVMAIVAGLTIVVNIIVQVSKSAFPKLPTNILTIIVSIVVTVLAVIIACTVMKITVMWYYAVGAVVLGIFVSYAAMFGFDKFKESLDKLGLLKK